MRFSNKKNKLIISVCVVLVILSCLTAYALINNEETAAIDNATINTNISSTNQSDGLAVDDVLDGDVLAITEKNDEDKTTKTTYISQKDDEGGCVYEFTLEDINRAKNGVEVGQSIELGDYVYTYGYTAIKPGGTVENGGLVPQDTGYDLGWHAAVKDKTKKSYGPICEYIFGIPVTDVTYLFAECSNVEDGGYPELPRYITFKENWNYQK